MKDIDLLESEVSSVSVEKGNNVALAMMKELENAETYFISWLGEEYTLIGKSVNSVIKNLSYNKSNYSDEELEYTFSVWKIQTFDCLIDPLVESFFCILFGEIPRAEKIISWARKTAELCQSKNVISEEYSKGIEYICDLLDIHTKIKNELEVKEKGLFLSEKFDSLPNKAKAMVWLAKLSLRDLMGITTEECQHIYKQIINVDEDNWLWHWRLWEHLRLDRKFDKILIPHEEELKAMSCAINLTSSTDYNELITSEFCNTLTDVLTHRISVEENDSHEEINLASLSFKSNEEAVDYIKTEARKALNKQNTFREANILKTYSKIFSSGLPLPLQDSSMAETCKNAYLKTIHSNCDEKVGNKLFLQAHKRIYNRLINRILILLRKPDENAEQLHKVFSTIWKTPEYWKPQELYSLHFLNGCYLSMKDDFQNAVDEWLKMDFSNEITSLFSSIDLCLLPRIIAKYGWTKDVNWEKAREQIMTNICQPNISDSSLIHLNLKILETKVEKAMAMDPKFCQLIKSKGSLMTPGGQDDGLHDKLGNCETYFIHWLADYQIRTENLSSMTQALYKKCIIMTQLNEEDVKEIFIDYTTNTLPQIISRVVEAFLNISCGNVDLFQKNISCVEFSVKYCIESNLFSINYAQGIIYLCGLLKIHCSSISKNSREGREEYSAYSFDELSNEGKAMVFLAKLTLNKLIADREKESESILRQIVNLDPTNWQWRFDLFRSLNTVRKKGKNAPGEEEQNSSFLAMEYSRSSYMYHSMCAEKFCDLVAEILTYRVHNDIQNTKMFIGSKCFNSHEHAVEFIKTEATKILEISEASYVALRSKNYSNIFSHGLPFRLRDLHFSKKCKEAYSKTYDLLTNRNGVQVGFKDSIQGFKKFLEENKEDYRELINFVQLNLEFPDKNADKLNEVFTTIWNQTDHWKKHEKYSFHFLHGCYFAMKADIANAVDHCLQMDLETAGDTDAAPSFLFLDFAILHRIKSYYDWEVTLNLSNARFEILQRLTQINLADASEKTKLEGLKVKVENALRIELLGSEDVKAEDRTAIPPDMDVETFEICIHNSLYETNSTLTPLSEENALLLKTELEKSEHYFISWLDGYQITNRRLVSITTTLYKFTVVPDQQTEEELKESYTANEMMTLQNIICPIFEAFLNISCGHMDLVAKNISWVECTINHCMKENIFSEDYAEGFNYLCSLLKIHANLKFGTATSVDYKTFTTISVDCLSSKGQSIVMAAKWVVIEQIHTLKENSVHVLKQVVELDRSNWVWNYLLCSRMRFDRRQNYTRSAPDEEEFNAIVNAVQHSVSTIYSTMCVSGLCQSLAEIVNHFWYNKKEVGNLPKIGDRTFKSLFEIVDYVKTEAGKAFKGNRLSFAEAIRYAEIFTSLLPFEHRDYELAEKCYNYCFEIFPSDSKTHHKMGVLQLTGKGDILQAKVYFKRAVELESKNFPAWMDLLQTLLGSPNDNEEEISKAFEAFWKQELFWNENNIFSVRFLEGCHLAIRGEVKKAVSHWKMYNSHTTPFGRTSDFHELPRIYKRYKWQGSAKLDMRAIGNEIVRQMETSSTEDVQKLNSLKLKLTGTNFNERGSFHGPHASSFTSNRNRNNSFNSENTNTTVADNELSWRTSRTNTASLSNNNRDSPRMQAAATSSNRNPDFLKTKPTTNKYVPPHLRK